MHFLDLIYKGMYLIIYINLFILILKLINLIYFVFLFHHRNTPIRCDSPAIPKINFQAWKV